MEDLGFHRPYAASFTLLTHIGDVEHTVFGHATSDAYLVPILNCTIVIVCVAVKVCPP